MRLARRDTFREAVFACRMPFWAARIISGSAARRAAAASVWLPEAIASSTLRTKVRMRLRRDRLISVRFAILRVIFLADTVLAMACPRSFISDAAGSWSELRRRSVDCMETEEPAGCAGSCVAAYRREKRQRQRKAAFARQKNAAVGTPPPPARESANPGPDAGAGMAS